MNASALAAPVACCRPASAADPASPAPDARGRARGRSRPASRGEREAFDRLVERYQRDVYRLCYRYVGNHEDANDMAQEVFLKAYRGHRAVPGRQRVLDLALPDRREHLPELPRRAAARPEELPETLPDRRVPAVERLLEEARAASRCATAVARLPEKQRATLILKVYHDLTHEEVAGILGSSVGTVKANLFHALGNLRKLDGGRAGD